MVIEPFVRMGLPPRSLAAEANDCFMVRPRHGPAEYKGAARAFARNGGLPPVRFTTVSVDGAINVMQKGGEPNLIERCAVLAAIKTASRDAL
jgi:hypothetical protein